MNSTPPLPALLDWARNAAFGVGALDEHGRFEYLNDAWVHHFGYDRDDLMGRPVAELLDAVNARIYEEQFEARKAGSSQPYAITYTVRNGQTFDSVLAPYPRFDENGEFRGSFGLCLPKDSRLVETVATLTSSVQGPVAAPKSLTSRERDVYSLLVAGSTAATIARSLHISVFTVRNHLRSIYSKCGVHSQMELISSLRSRGGKATPSEE